MQQNPEQILISGLKHRDRGAMKELYGLYSGYLTAVCSRYVADADAVRDVLHDSFIKIFSSVDGFEYRGPGSLKAWLTRITVNEALKYLKKSAKEGKILTYSDDEAVGIPDDSGDEINIDDIPPSEIQKMIRRLPEGYRTIFNLFVFEDKSHKEIAEMLGIKENSSASQLHRAKALLSKWINEYRNSN